MAQPPPLPPRANTARSISPSASSQSSVDARLSRKDTIHLTPYATSHSPPPPYESNYPYSSRAEWADADPRSSSMHSLRPVESAGGSRRTLLLVYIHGFMGDETSFRSFPAHVHNLVTLTLAETHVVHTKIYPRYKSRRDISYARDDFSNWLYPHESSTTDVILLGHSLGGILAAEVALLQSHVPNSDSLYQHRILGVIAFDTPFLGMHPSVVGTGIASLFRPTAELPDAKSPTGLLSPNSAASGSLLSPSDSGISDPFSLLANDPNYDPDFRNDVRRPQRSKLENALYFWNKHCGEMTKATRSYLTSHLEFGGCMADYPGLKRRYDAIRALEDVNELSLPQGSSGKLLRRVRFVNYYSASTGRIKTVGATNVITNTSVPTDVEMRDMNPNPIATSKINQSLGGTSSISPRLAVEEHRDGEVIQKELVDLDLADDPSEYARLSPRPLSVSSISSVPVLQELDRPEDQDLSRNSQTGDDRPESDEPRSQINDDLPAIPPLPTAPPEFDASKYSAKDVLKVAQKDYDRQVKAFERAKKDRERSIRDREKMIQKREKTAAKEQAKREKLAKQQENLERKEKLKQNTTLNPETHQEQMRQNATEEGMPEAEQTRKKQKDRKFCMLPSKDKTGLRDPAWIRVYMEGMDEVAAHTSLFFVSETYAKLVGDTATRIENWVNEDATKNAILADG